MMKESARSLYFKKSIITMYCNDLTNFETEIFSNYFKVQINFFKLWDTTLLQYFSLFSSSIHLHFASWWANNLLAIFFNLHTKLLTHLAFAHRKNWREEKTFNFSCSFNAYPFHYVFFIFMKMTRKAGNYFHF